MKTQKSLILSIVLLAVSTNLFAQPESGFKVEVDPRIELLAVVQSMTKWPEMGAFTNLDFEYYDDVKKYFAPHQEHPAVQWFDDNLLKGWNFDAPPTAMLHLSNPPKMKVVIPFSAYLKQRGKGEENLNEMVKLLNQFAKDADFMKFWNEHQPFYQEFIGRIKKQAPFDDYTKLMVEFYGEEKGNFVFIPAPLFHAGGYGPQVKTDKGAIAYNLGGPQYLKDGFPAYKADNLRRLLFHEFGHSFVNPVVYEHSEELNKYQHYYKYMESTMQSLSYGDWLTVCHEHLVRTGETFLLKAAGFPEEAEDAYHGNFQAYGFKLLPFFSEKMEVYQKNRDKYQTYREFFPELIKVLDEVEWVTEEGPGPMNFAMNLTGDHCKIASISANTPFAKAGGKEGDFVHELNGIKFDGNTYLKLTSIWYEAKIGDKFAVVFIRDGEEIKAEVEVPPGKISKFVKKKK